jgi:hypothetical protein
MQDAGTSAISLLTADLPALLSALRQKGTPIETVDGTKSAIVRDPSGIPIELIERR